jgi:hypothetical protein
MRKLLLLLSLTTLFTAVSASAHSHEKKAPIIYTAVKDFPKTDGGEVPYTVPKKDDWRQVLSINAAKVAYRDKFARAERDYDGEAGTFDVTIVTLTEFDGECVYRLLVDRKVVATFTNPRVGKEGDFKQHRHTWKGVKLKYGARLAVESNTASNGLIPEGDGFAWARGRWSQLELSPAE